ncbi:MAG: GntR family transcriptional regulator [Culturomica sp.]|jgi:predicted RNA-binding protein (virulence factor B family)|nr:GntR family transcriptional regulator [Culturomica sp.]
MIKIGGYNTLRVVKVVDFGVYLDGEERGEILLPNEYVPKNCFPDDFVKVFIYFDSDDRIIATTETPYVTVGEFAFMKVVAVTGVGAFLDWGLRKDLLVPFREQRQTMQEGRDYFVYAYFDDESDRIVATSKIEKYLDKVPAEYEVMREVEILVWRKTEIGYAVIINNAHTGLIYDDEIFKPLRVGQRMSGYIKKIREDGKIDVSLQKAGYDQIDSLADRIMVKLQDNAGVLDISDKTSPETIYGIFGCSKKNYKKALGLLLKTGKILVSDHEIKEK